MKAIILAAGKGKRLLSEECHIPKGMRLVCGKPLLGYVTEALNFIEKKDIHIVVGFEKEKIIEAFSNGYNFSVQEKMLGTGHAVESAYPALKDYDGDLIVICGDTPLIQQSTILNMIEQHKKNKNSCTVLSCMGEKGLALGRMIHDKDGKLTGIVEDKDCTPEQKEICEYNAATYVFDAKAMFKALEKVGYNNKQGEKYLTDVPMIMISEGLNVESYASQNSYEILGVNTPEDLAEAERLVKQLGK
ncbi:MAG: NTP transferase domain-containing protein [Clostridia bacterium]|nr:NTP transferase domain-containing protein [Clostridia bacterium]